MPILWKYYIDTTIYNLGLSLLVGVYTDFLWGLLTFGTIGTVIGFILYAYFKEQQYYFYYNYGYTQPMLMFRVWGINLVVILVSFVAYAVVMRVLF